MIKSTRDPDLRIEDDQVYLTRGDRQYRIRGLEKNLSALQLSVSILATRDELVYLDTVDLVKARARNAFIKAASSELYCEEERIKKDVGRLLLQLEQLQLQQIEAAKRPRSAVVMDSVPGVGTVTTATLVCELPELGQLTIP